MSEHYQAVQWNRQKRRYDVALSLGILLFLLTSIGVGAATHPNITAETLILRAFGSAAIVLLHIILCIGPLCRLDPRFLPLLYNRRHLGVSMFLLAAVHGLFATMQFHLLGDLNPFVSVLASNPRIDSVSQFPFEILGWVALIILFLMAATSHDFWLANLSAPVWKRLHMSVYLAYALLILHVALGALQSETRPVFTVLIGLGAVTVFGLHLAAGIREVRRDGVSQLHSTEDWMELCPVGDIPRDRARIFPVGGERVAVFRYDGKISAISNVCQHQGGPLGEGKVVGGCVTCPWHGYQYEPDTGRSPAPFVEKVPTFAVRVVDGVVWIDPAPRAPGTPIPPASVAEQV